MAGDVGHRYLRECMLRFVSGKAAGVTSRNGSAPLSVLVTGASGGVGRAVARAYGTRGASVTLVARGEEGLEAAARDVRGAGGTALVAPTDVADFDEVSAAADAAENAFGPIDVWVNNAFSSVFAPFDEISAAEYRRTTEVSYLGFVFGTRVALDRMKPRNHGTIVQVGSALAYRGIPLQSAYCGAKHAIQGFTESLRCELLHDHSRVRITMVQLPAMNTPQFSWVLSRLPRRPQPVPPIYQPELAARAIVRAADHPGRREYWVGASTAATLIANAVAPGILDRYLARTGYRSQQTQQAASPDQSTNLWQPVDQVVDYGAQGRFSSEAHDADPQVWASQHHGLLATAATFTGAIAVRAAWRHYRR
jgi:NAD(P)-dependent dehydrogenase (short-subunit alcohol dehydrogenase family)